MGAALLLLLGAAAGAACVAALLTALFYFLTCQAADAPPSAAASASRNGASAVPPTQQAGCQSGAAPPAPAAAASVGPLLRVRGRYGGRVWTVPGGDWRAAAAGTGPPHDEDAPPRGAAAPAGAGGGAMQWSGRLRRGVLKLTADGAGTATDQPRRLRIPLAGCGVRVVHPSASGGPASSRRQHRELNGVINSPSGSWWRKGPLEVCHSGGRPLFEGRSSFLLFAPDGPAKEQWHAALLWACGGSSGSSDGSSGGGEVRRVGAVYAAFCERALAASGAAVQQCSGPSWRPEGMDPLCLSRRSLLRGSPRAGTSPFGSGAASPVVTRSGRTSPVTRSFMRRRLRATTGESVGSTGAGNAEPGLVAQTDPAPSCPSSSPSRSPGRTATPRPTMEADPPAERDGIRTDEETGRSSSPSPAPPLPGGGAALKLKAGGALRSKNALLRPAAAEGGGSSSGGGSQQSPRAGGGDGALAWQESLPLSPTGKVRCVPPAVADALLGLQHNSPTLINQPPKTGQESLWEPTHHQRRPPHGRLFRDSGQLGRRRPAATALSRWPLGRKRAALARCL